MPLPSEKMREGGVCESLSSIVFLFPPECWVKPLIACNVNAMAQVISVVVPVMTCTTRQKYIELHCIISS